MKHIDSLRVELAGQAVGTLALDARGRIYFQYDPLWLQNGFDLSPGTLPFKAGAQLSPEPQVFSGLHGVFYDSLPDGWGLLLMDRAFRQQFGWQPREITPLDRLAYIGSRAMGALEYVPAMPVPVSPDTLNIVQLAHAAERLLHGDTPEVLQQLQVHGGSPGGARPKVTVALSAQADTCLSGFQPLLPGYQHWLVKFRAREDSMDMGRIEFAYAQMARLAGLEVPECRLLPVGTTPEADGFFAVRRFDRQGNARLHVLSLAGYVYADHRLPCIGYESVINATYNITRSKVEAERAFRLMLFNILAHNKDDHTKNFAFVRQVEGWVLAPAFDLTFSAGINNQHTTDIAGSGNPNLRDIQQVATSCGIKHWQEMLEQVHTATRQWESLAAAAGVLPANMQAIATALQAIAQRLGL